MMKTYRQDYHGEYVVLDRTLTQGRWENTTQWVENNLEFYPTSASAIVLGTGNQLIDINVLKQKKFTTYSLSQETDFRLVNTPTESSSVLYARLDYIKTYPGEFFLVPNDPGYDDLNTLIYLAAFDGHRQIYLLDIEETETLTVIVSVYSDVEFIKVSRYGRDNTLASLQYQPNYKQIALVDFDLDLTV